MIPKFSEGDLIANRFRIRQKVGHGGFGIVYLAQDETIARQIAIKFVRSDERALSVLHEARVAGRLMHPNIVTIFDVGRVDNDLFIAMEYVDGAPLSKYMKRDALSLDDRLQLIVQMCRGLSAAHDAKVIHRDIKPQNLLVDRQLRLKIADFGMARASGAVSIAGSGTVGTLDYMAPEQLKGPHYDHRVDIFSAAVVAYELLACTRAYDSSMGLAQLAHRRLITTELPPLPAACDPIGRMLDRIIARGTELEPRHRFESAAAMAEQFDEAVRRLQAIRRADTIAVDDLMWTPSNPQDADGSAVPKPQIRSPQFGHSQTPESATRARTTAAVVGAFVVVGVAYLVWPRPASEPAPASEAPFESATEPLSTSIGPAPNERRGRAGDATPARPRAAVGSTPAPAAQNLPPTSVTSAAPATETMSDPPVEELPSEPTPDTTGDDSNRQEESVSMRGIRDTLAAYVRAHANRSSAALKTLQPGLSSDELAAFDRTFAENETYSFGILNVAIAVDGPTARVTCDVSRVLSAGGTQRQLSRPAAINLERTPNGNWIVTAFRMAP